MTTGIREQRPSAKPQWPTIEIDEAYSLQK